LVLRASGSLVKRAFDTCSGGSACGWSLKGLLEEALLFLLLRRVLARAFTGEWVNRLVAPVEAVECVNGRVCVDDVAQVEPFGFTFHYSVDLQEAWKLNGSRREVVEVHCLSSKLLAEALSFERRRRPRFADDVEAEFRPRGFDVACVKLKLVGSRV
jgi:hypothetical protein